MGRQGTAATATIAGASGQLGQVTLDVAVGDYAGRSARRCLETWQATSSTASTLRTATTADGL